MSVKNVFDLTLALRCEGSAGPCFLPFLSSHKDGLVIYLETPLEQKETLHPFIS